MNEFLDALETRDPHERERAALTALSSLIAKVKSTPGWGRILADVDPQQITTRAALAQLPVTRKSELHQLQQAALPFGGLTSTSTRQLRRIYMSPGPIFDAEGHGVDWWRCARPMFAAGVRAGHIVQNCFSHHFTPAAAMVDGGAARLGCAVIPAGIGQTEMQVQAMQSLRPDVYAGTPSFLKIIVEKALEMGADISSVQRAIVGAEALPPSLRTWLREHDIPHVLQMYGSADVGNIAYESQTDGEVHAGMILDEELLLEIVRPGTGDPVAEGEVGEVVITSFNPDYPLIRFGTGDMSAILQGTSPCGRTNTRIRGWLGRADQTAKVRAMFIHPSQVAQVLKRYPAISKARLVVSGSMGNDEMVLHCEVEQPDAAASLTAAVVDSIRDVTKLRGEVRFVALDSLPNDGKVIDDIRKYE